MTIDDIKPGMTISWPDGFTRTITEFYPEGAMPQIHTRPPTDAELLAAKLGVGFFMDDSEGLYQCTCGLATRSYDFCFFIEGDEGHGVYRWNKK